MADEAALIDAPVDTAAEIDNAVDTSVSDAVDTSASGETQPEGDAGEALRGSALWREVKSLTQEGKPLTPKQLSALNKVIHRADAIDSKYPDGLTAMEGTMRSIRQLAADENEPIDQVIENSVKELGFFRNLDRMFSSGKKEFVDELNQTSTESFQNIAPEVFRKYAEVNPEGYSAYVAQAAVGHMNSAGVPMQFQVIEAFWPQVPNFPGKEQFQKALVGIIEWTDALKGLAATKITPKVIPGQETAQPGKDLAQQNEQLKIENSRIQWNGSVREEGISFVMSEAQKAAGRAVLTDADKKSVLAKVGEELEARLTADRRYGEAMQQYLKSGNRSAYLQRIQSERKKLIPGAVRRAVSDVIEARPKTGPKPAVNQGSNGQNTARKPAAQLTGAVQFKRIAGPPRTLGMKVDLSKTSHTMLEKRQAILVGGERVQWGPVARA